jgi:hypothetical protein
MALLEAAERPRGRVHPLLGHPGDVRHHARAEAGRQSLLRGVVAKLGEIALEVGDGGVLHHAAARTLVTHRPI